MQFLLNHWAVEYENVLHIGVALKAFSSQLSENENEHVCFSIRLPHGDTVMLPLQQCS